MDMRSGGPLENPGKLCWSDEVVADLARMCLATQKTSTLFKTVAFLEIVNVWVCCDRYWETTNESTYLRI